MTRQAFEQMLGQRGIDRHYGLKELQDDLAHASRLHDDWDDRKVDDAYEQMIKEDQPVP